MSVDGVCFLPRGLSTWKLFICVLGPSFSMIELGHCRVGVGLRLCELFFPEEHHESGTGVLLVNGVSTGR